MGDRESEAGFEEALRNRPEIPRIILRHDGQITTLLRNVEQARREGVDGLVVARSSHALTVLTALLRLGVRVPEEISLISRDDDLFLSRTVPQICRYSSDPQQWARQIARRVRALAEGTDLPLPSARLMPRFVDAESLH